MSFSIARWKEAQELLRVKKEALEYHLRLQGRRVEGAWGGGRKEEGGRRKEEGARGEWKERKGKEGRDNGEDTEIN
jgi:hypothetical protein